MSRHPLEEKWNVSAADILTAIEHGFRAQADVKGKLAEYYLFKRLQELEKDGRVKHVQWPDRDGQPDFLVDVRDRTLRIECKNVRSPQAAKQPTVARVEIQRTRNSMDGTPTRAYRADEFDILAACLFNVTGRWDFLYVVTTDLRGARSFPSTLKSCSGCRCTLMVRG
ncbi:MAG: hypothetical protein ACLQBA_25000 [Candidatus Binataceae bacterium]